MTDKFELPVGNDAPRPTQVATGCVRPNPDSGQPEVFNGKAWVALTEDTFHFTIGSTYYLP